MNGWVITGEMIVDGYGDVPVIYCDGRFKEKPARYTFDEPDGKDARFEMRWAQTWSSAIKNIRFIPWTTKAEVAFKEAIERFHSYMVGIGQRVEAL